MGSQKEQHNPNPCSDTCSPTINMPTWSDSQEEFHLQMFFGVPSNIWRGGVPSKSDELPLNGDTLFLTWLLGRVRKLLVAGRTTELGGTSRRFLPNPGLRISTLTSLPAFLNLSRFLGLGHLSGKSSNLLVCFGPIQDSARFEKTLGSIPHSFQPSLFFKKPAFPQGFLWFSGR